MTRATHSEMRVAFRNWRSVIGLLMAQDLNGRFKGSKLSVFLSLFQPLLMVAVFTFLRSALHFQFPVFGTSPVVFFASGFLPFYIFIRISAIATSAARGRSRLPRIHGLDRMIAGTITETLTNVLMLGMLFAGLYYFGNVDDARPRDIATCAAACILLVFMGLGMGLINACIFHYAVAWRLFYRIFIRMLMVLSGLFYIVDTLPYYLRSIVVWNPLAHGIEWFRVGLYGERYPAWTLDIQYFMEWSLALLFVGVILYQHLVRKAGEKS